MTNKFDKINKTGLIGDAISSKYSSISNFSNYPNKNKNVSELTKITDELIHKMHEMKIKINNDDAVKSFIQLVFKQSNGKFRFNSHEIELEDYIEVTRRLLVYSSEYEKLIEGRK